MCKGSEVIKLFLIYFLLGFQSGHSQDFGYDGNEGPSHWGSKYQKCVGKHQSPIDIEDDNVKLAKFPDLKFEYFDKHLAAVKIQNNGHTVALSIIKGKTPVIHGGPLKGKYKFAQLHFHWGTNDNEGSENMINNHSFPLELHMVFFKTNYNNFAEAANYSYGLTVLSFLYHATDEGNKNYDQFESGLSLVHNFSSAIEISNFVPLDKFITTDRKVYYTYEGSLTTPPCSEEVTWIEFKNTIPLSHQQIQQFRQLSGGHGHQLIHNFRPTQPLYDRVIYMNSSAGSLVPVKTLVINLVLLIISQISSKNKF